MLKITPILCRAGKMDNYAYLLTDEATGVSAVLDPSEAAPVIAECERQNVRPAYIFNSHHHFDHVEGNLEVKEKYGAKVLVGAYDCNRIPGADAGLADGDVFRLGESEARIIRADGHATGHILWYFPADGVLFTGDVLFNLSIGGLFEGTVEEMWGSLQRIKKLPDDTLFYPGHEYTLYGLNGIYGPAADRYAAKAEARLREGLPAAPFTLGEEKACNPYLACRNLGEFYQIMGS